MYEGMQLIHKSLGFLRPLLHLLLNFGYNYVPEEQVLFLRNKAIAVLVAEFHDLVHLAGLHFGLGHNFAEVHEQVSELVGVQFAVLVGIENAEDLGNQGFQALNNCRPVGLFHGI